MLVSIGKSFRIPNVWNASIARNVQILGIFGNVENADQHCRRFQTFQTFEEFPTFDDVSMPIRRHGKQMKWQTIGQAQHSAILKQTSCDKDMDPAGNPCSVCSKTAAFNQSEAHSCKSCWGPGSYHLLFSRPSMCDPSSLSPGNCLQMMNQAWSNHGRR